MEKKKNINVRLDENLDFVKEASLPNDDTKRNIHVNFVLMIAKKGQNIIQPAEYAHNQFLNGANNNVLVGNCYHNVFNGSKNNIIIYAPQIIEVEDKKLSRWERIKTAWSVYKELKQLT